jgi:GTP cyclohydrolase IA
MAADDKPVETEDVRYLAAAKSMKEVLQHLGIDLQDENFQTTPERFVKYLAEFLQPYDAKDILKSSFSTKKAEYHGMVIQSNIPFRSACAHHLLPFFGVTHIGYIPNGRVVGLSKLARLVRAVGLRSPSIQETITDDIADALYEELEPKGVIVVISAVHTCMTARGIAAPNVPTTTSTVRGVYRDVPAAREEFFNALQLGKAL